MGTLLVTSKMSPELAARIEAAVTGKRPSRRESRLAAQLKGLARTALVVAVIAAIVLAVRKWRNDHRELARERTELLDRVAQENARLTDADRHALARDEALLSTWSGSYPGDLTAESVRGPGALPVTLARRVVYVRGPIDGFPSAKVAKTEVESVKDALLYCLVDPPTSKTEKALLGRVKTAYAAGEMEKRTPNVRRLADAVGGQRFLLPAWSERVAAAEERETILAYRSDFDHQNFDRFRDALRAEVLVAVMDEPGATLGPTEMDGERPHPIRLVVYDLVADAPLLRRRATVDPSGFSASARAEYASAMDGCGVAYDVKTSLAP